MIGNQLQRELKYWQVLRRRKQYQFVRAVLVGFLAGGIAVLFEKALHMTEVARDHLLLMLAPHWIKWLAIPLLCALAGGLAAFITRRYAPEAAGSGIPHIKAVLLNLRSLRKRVLPVKFLGGLLSIGAGFSLGREGPTVQMGAVAGKIVAEKLHVSKRFHNQLVASGAGAGLAAAFNAPLAGFVFVIEELQRELSPITYGTALIAAVLGDVMTRTFTGQMPSFHVHGYETPSLGLLPAFIVLGAVCGVIGTLFNKGIIAAAKTPESLKSMPTWLRAMLRNQLE